MAAVDKALSEFGRLDILVNSKWIFIISSNFMMGRFHVFWLGTVRELTQYCFTHTKNLN